MLDTGMINVVIVLVDQLPNRDNTVTLLLQIGNNAPDGSWRTGPGVMKQHNGTGLNLAHHTLVDLVAAQALPIERVHRPLDGVIVEGRCGGNDPVIILAERRSEDYSTLTSQISDHGI